MAPLLNVGVIVTTQGTGALGTTQRLEEIGRLADFQGYHAGLLLKNAGSHFPIRTQTQHLVKELFWCHLPMTLASLPTENSEEPLFLIRTASPNGMNCAQFASVKANSNFPQKKRERTYYAHT